MFQNQSSRVTTDPVCVECSPVGLVVSVEIVCGEFQFDMFAAIHRGCWLRISLTPLRLHIFPPTSCLNAAFWPSLPSALSSALPLPHGSMLEVSGNRHSPFGWQQGSFLRGYETTTLTTIDYCEHFFGNFNRGYRGTFSHENTASRH